MRTVRQIQPRAGTHGERGARRQDIDCRRRSDPPLGHEIAFHRLPLRRCQNRVVNQHLADVPAKIASVEIAAESRLRPWKTNVTAGKSRQHLWLGGDETIGGDAVHIHRPAGAIGVIIAVAGERPGSATGNADAVVAAVPTPDAIRAAAAANDTATKEHRLRRTRIAQHQPLRIRAGEMQHGQTVDAVGAV